MSEGEGREGQVSRTRTEAEKDSCAMQALPEDKLLRRTCVESLVDVVVDNAHRDMLGVKAPITRQQGKRNSSSVRVRCRRAAKRVMKACAPIKVVLRPPKPPWCYDLDYINEGKHAQHAVEQFLKGVHTNSLQVVWRKPPDRIVCIVVWTCDKREMIGAIVGCLYLSTRASGPTFDIHGLNVVRRRQGIGSTLLTKLVETVLARLTDTPWKCVSIGIPFTGHCHKNIDSCILYAEHGWTVLYKNAPITVQGLRDLRIKAANKNEVHDIQNNIQVQYRSFSVSDL